MQIHKILLSFSGVIVALSIGYYFAFYLPKTNEVKMLLAKQERDMENQQKCKDTGQKAYEADKKAHGGELYEPQFAYNANLNTCLYGGGYMNTYKICDGGLLSDCTRGSWERFVRDAYTNNDIIAIVNWNIDGEWSHPVEDITEFEEQYNKLMGF